MALVDVRVQNPHERQIAVALGIVQPVAHHKVIRDLEADIIRFDLLDAARGFVQQHASTDAPGLQRFYSQLFDWPIDANNPMQYGLVKAAGPGSIGGGVGPAMGGGPGHVTVFVQVPDLAAALARAEHLGGKTLVPPTEIPGMVTFAMFQDPEGHAIGLVKG